ncbi:SusF/SusE family outer membrane protein [Flavobacterium sp. CYK-55]|uniref:SusF/SusE family outer membrane protein n=1 Tax=Flavobacterium sp. CYK-55 TaxID=2835529 RepID=UPI001BCD6AFE|nr:T9SS type A sorting domain-containing protein [Flavobacterium sp. CYK-55]MBS7786263.1 SusF/SusE family outer membrane protein [Flavobacterium sp. CYK-55]
MKTKLLLLLLVFFGWTSQAQVSMIGPGATGTQWDADIDLLDQGGGIWSLTNVTMPGGEFKFRKNHSWGVNWGAVGFPTGTGVQDGPNITAISGTYDVTFNENTGEYSFSGGAPVPVVKLVGAAVSDVNGISFITTDGVVYTASNVTLLDGNAQFDIDGSLVGETTFPTGTLSGASDNIPVVGGGYTSITLDLSSGNYTFVAAPIYPVISIIGSAVGGWDEAHEVDMATNDGVMYTATVTLDGTAGNNELKFRTGHDWGLPNYGASDWPTGIATTTGGNIPVAASGTYSVTFNLTTGEYNFFFPGISLVGDATPGGWPTGTPGEIDPAQLTTTDGLDYQLASISLVVGGAKFRQNNDWATNWGAADFPAGTATPGGANIAVATAGDYGILFNRVSGVYTFGAPLANNTFSKSNFVVAPNPTNNAWTFASSNKAIISIQIVDVLGNVVATIAPQATTTSVDASSLAKGLYMAKISTANGSETVKLMKN